MRGDTAGHGNGHPLKEIQTLITYEMTVSELSERLALPGYVWEMGVSSTRHGTKEFPLPDKVTFTCKLTPVP